MSPLRGLVMILLVQATIWLPIVAGRYVRGPRP
jgi:hypothetical protein